jgi:transcriptional regulator with XRE-family HTH domain
MTMDKTNDLAKIIKQRRMIVSMTLQELARATGVSASHLGRIERGERFPSARILRRLAGPLHMEEAELMSLAGYLSSEPTAFSENSGSMRLDPYVSMVLSQEPVEVQRTVIGILTILKNIAKGLSKEGS